MAKLTKTYVEDVQPPAAGYEIHWDEKVPGYGLRVTSNGVRSFVAQGRVRGKAVIVTIGRFGLYTEDKARKRAQAILQDMREGIDPRDVKRSEEAMKVTLGEVMERYVVARGDKLKDSTAAEMKRHVEKVFADWKDQPIIDITELDVRKRHEKMSREGLRGKPAPGQANIAMTTLRTLINFAGREYRLADGSPLIQRNPVVNGLSDRWAVLEPRAERYIDPKKVGDVWHMLTTTRADLIAAQQREDGKVNPQDADKQAGVELVMILLLTGARRNEAAQLEWRNVNLDEGWWHIPDPKNRKPIWLPLSDQAVAILRERKPVKGNPYVFTSRSKAGYVTDTRAPLVRMSKVAGLTLSAHDLRRSFCTIGVDVLDIDQHKIERLTNHVAKSVTGKHYLSSQRLERLAPEVKRIGDWIEEQGRIAEAKANSDNVVPLRA
jgi:integrase